MKIVRHDSLDILNREIEKYIGGHWHAMMPVTQDAKDGHYDLVCYWYATHRVELGESNVHDVLDEVRDNILTLATMMETEAARLRGLLK